MKLNIPCLPGFTPVMNVVHATGVCAGIGGIVFPSIPSFLIFLKVGSFSIHFSTSIGDMPSDPMTKTFIFLLP